MAMHLLDKLQSASQFHMEKYLADRRRAAVQQAKTDHRFLRAVDRLDEYLKQVQSNDEDAYQQRQFGAVTGHPAAKAYFLRIIEDFLLAYPEFDGIPYPSYYKDLPEALFQETLGFGPISIWFGSKSEAAQINGTAILFEENGVMVTQPFRYQSVDHVLGLIRAITLANPHAQSSDQQPFLDTEMRDGTRVSIMRSPFLREPVISFRQFPMKTFTFEEEARRGTIPEPAQLWFEELSRCMWNICLTGPKRSGKSTMLKVIFGARDPRHVVVTVERDHYELALKRDFPERADRIIEGRVTVEDMYQVNDYLLRQESTYAIVPEIRSSEIDLVYETYERGLAWLTTYHSPRILDIPRQFASLSLRAHPTRDFMTEYERAASNLHVVISMDLTDFGGKERKIAYAVHAIDYNDEQGYFRTIPWMTYDAETNQYAFHCEVPKRLMQEASNSRTQGVRIAWKNFISQFEALAKKYPMKDPDIQKKSIRGNVV